MYVNLAVHTTRFVSFRFVSFRFVSFLFDLFRFVSICFVSFRFVSFRFDLFRFVPFRFCFVSHFTGTHKLLYLCAATVGVLIKRQHGQNGNNQR